MKMQWSNVTWNTSSTSANGVRPPNPQTLGGPLQNKEGDLWAVQSGRVPYASEYLVTKYGGLETKLGTGLGSK
jgi:hypothetical protein